MEEVVVPEGVVNHRELDGWDDVCDASQDSFPASDPPAWAGMRVGGPRRGPVAPGAASPPRRGDVVRAHVAPDSRSSLIRWLEGQWPQVHVCFAEIFFGGSASSERRPRLRAVVQLGGLTPADVHVTARLAAAGSEPTSREPLRLWSVQSHHNGAFVFEAAAAPPPGCTIDGATDLLVTVTPAPAGHAEVPLSDVVRLVASGAPADCASPAPFARASFDTSGEARPGDGRRDESLRAR
jgi:hypothetical protein